MKQFLMIIFLIGIILPAGAKQESKYPLTMVQSNKEVAVRGQNGSLYGFVKPLGNNQYVQYNKYHQRVMKYQVEGNKVKIYNRAGH